MLHKKAWKCMKMPREMRKLVLGITKHTEALDIDPVDLSESKRLSREARAKTKHKPVVPDDN